VGKGTIERSLINLIRNFADGNVCHAQTGLSFRNLLLDEIIGKVLAELVEARKLGDILGETEPFWRKSRTARMVEVSEQNEPFASIECNRFKYIHSSNGSDAMKENQLT
jgi:hypothetical protein